MSWKSTRTCKVVLAVCLLAGCSEKPMAPGRGDSPAGPFLAGHPAPPGGASTIPDSMRSWFAERGITLLTEIPADPAGKAASDERLLGDGSGNGIVSWWDFSGTCGTT